MRIKAGIWLALLCVGYMPLALMAPFAQAQDQFPELQKKLDGLYTLTKLSADVDLLVVGSRGHGRFGGAFHGSVSSYLERHVASALLILPRDPTPAPAAGAEEQQLAEATTSAG